MRNEKYKVPENYWEGDDIGYAFRNNSLENRLHDIDVIVAEICGENDGVSWYWILQMKDGTFSWAKGGCDYTGWDCQSHAEISDGYKTAHEAVDAVKVEYDSRLIHTILHAQIDEKVPFATYVDVPSPSHQ